MSTEKDWADYAWQHPDPAVLVAQGCVGVARYVSEDPSKNLTKAEAEALHKAGLSILLVWETTATRAADGYTAGVLDAQTANGQADALGYPAGAVLFYAVDFNAAPGDVLEYFRGIHDAGGRPAGSYGSKAVIEGVHTAGLSRYEWQTQAWSGTAVSPEADLYQRVIAVHVKAPGTDEDVQLAPVPAWDPMGVPTLSTQPAVYVVPTPAPHPTTPPSAPGGLTVQTIDLRHVTNDPRTWVKGANVGPMQALLGVKRDNEAGPQTRAALGAAQHRAGLLEDYQFGTHTAEALLAGK